MRIFIFIILNFISYISLAQVPVKSFVVAGEFNKDEAIYEAKSFVATQVLGTSESVMEYQIDALAASTGGEITTIYYNCPAKKEDGIVLCFYGNYWNQAGVVLKGYAFKHFAGEKARSLLSQMGNSILEHEKYLYSDKINNNIYFNFEDLTIIAYVADATKFRVVWNGFDADWDVATFKKTQKRFASKTE